MSNAQRNGTRVILASLKHIELIAARMRESDRREAWLADRMTPQQALREAFKWAGRRTLTVISETEGPVAMGGVRAGMKSGTGIVWLLGTSWIDRHPVTALRAARDWLREFERDYDLLINWVHNSNDRAKQWLEVLGFSIGKPKAMGQDGALFCKFTRESPRRTDPCARP